MSNAIKKITYQFMKQHGITDVNYSVLKSVAKKLGYTLIEFNRILNDKDTQTVIQNLNLDDLVLQSRGFTYVSSDYRLIFISEDLNDDEKLLVLSHELGHIVCNHISSGSFIGKDLKDEYEANEFSHYLLEDTITRKIKNSLKKHKKLVVAVVLSFIVIATVGISVAKERFYYDDYYITATGNKFHKKNCIFIKNKTNCRRLTKKSFEEGSYEACDMCLPDKNN